MSSAECSMGLRSFLVRDEPLSAHHLKLSDGRLCEELEIKTLMRRSPQRTSIPQKHVHGYSVDFADARTPSTSSSSVSSSNGIRPPLAVAAPSRTPSTASTSLSSSGKPPLSSSSAIGNQIEYTEPTVLVTHRHSHSESKTAQIPNGTGALASSSPPLPDSNGAVARRNRHDSNSSATAADAEVCATLRGRSRTQTSDDLIEDELLDEEGVTAAAVATDAAIDGFDQLNISTDSLGGTRRRISLQTHTDVIRALKMPAPSKEQVLNYVANTKSLHIRRAGTELQVTDATGFPLLDVWQKSSCFQTTWILESYGRTVLLLNDVSRSWKPWSRNRSSVLEVEDSENELLGFFVVAEPFVVQSRERQPVARFNAYDSGDGRNILYQCVLECSGEEVGRLEQRKAQLSQLRFGQIATGFPLKLLILAAAIRIAAMPSAEVVSSPTARRSNKRRTSKANCCSIV